MRIKSPSYERNIAPITSLIEPIFNRAKGDVLEIGSGSGQHITTFAKMAGHLTFWPSEPDIAMHESITAWTNHQGVPNVKPPFVVDASLGNWFASEHEIKPTSLAAIFCFNVIHISPIEVTNGLIAGARKYLKPGGKLILYGPYKIDGKQTSQSNADFEQWLKAKDNRYGIKDIDYLEQRAIENGLALQDFHAMPANNFMPVFNKV